jgi:hypothetical protein
MAAIPAARRDIMTKGRGEGSAPGGFGSMVNDPEVYVWSIM